MSKKPFYVAILLTALFMFARVAIASTGFVSSPLWIDPESPKEGDNVVLSALFHNAESRTLNGTVLFYDGGTLLSKKAVTIAAGSVGTTSVAFRIAAGDHQFSATMSDMQELAPSGVLQVVALPVETAQMPAQFIPKQVDVVGAAANAGGQIATTSVAPILNQVGSVEQSALDKIPAPVKDGVTGIVNSVDSWRANNAELYVQGKTNAQNSLDKQKKLIDSQSKKKIATPAMTTYVERPLEYLKLFFFTLMTWIYSSKLIFYIFAVVFLYIIIRFIIRKLVKLFRGRRAHV